MKKDGEKLAEAVMRWWEDHEYDCTGEYDDVNVYDDAPEMVVIAKEILK